MSQLFFKGCSLVALIFVSLTIQAQENSQSEVEKLSFLVGKWTVNDVTQAGSTSEATQAIISWQHEGKFIQEQVKHLTQFGEINMMTFIGYDARYNAYKLSAMDKEYGLMDIYIGEWENNELIFENMSSDKAIIMEDGKQLNFRLTYSDIEKDSFKHKVEGTYDQGKTWFTFSISQYQKVS